MKFLPGIQKRVDGREGKGTRLLFFSQAKIDINGYWLWPSDVDEDEDAVYLVRGQKTRP